ncbi:MAG: 5'/3'-nucleotidase SurE [Isosphaeraceae bacterium]
MADHDRSLLLTNDDGVDAPGLQALSRAAEGLGRLRVVAPQGAASGCGHQVTTHAPIRIEGRGPDRFAVAGTPVDCVRLALHSLATDLDWVLSGVNAGGNLGTDVYHSGTVAAVREAAIRGRPGIAISHFIARGRTIDWAWAERQARRVLRLLLPRGCQPWTFWNVNLPHIDTSGPEPEIVFCPLDPSPLPADFQLEGDLATYSGVYQARDRRPGADVAVCFGGRIAVTSIRLDGHEELGRPGTAADPSDPSPSPRVP